MKVNSDLLKMNQCEICISYNILIECPKCLSKSCSLCIGCNNRKCCFCSNTFDECEQEVQRQISLLYTTKIDKEPIALDNSLFKQCPVCSIWVEKNTEDCPQLFCTICKTVWMWTTMKIVTERDNIHNPLYFDSIDNSNSKNYKSPSHFSLKVQRAINKCMKSLSNEQVKYTTDAYLNRLMYITNQISFEEFKTKSYLRFSKYKKFIKLKKILEQPIFTDCDVKTIDESYSIIEGNIKLPYV